MAWPRYVLFKGDNGHYLCAYWIERHPYLMFKGTDKGDPRAVHEVFTNVDGSIRIKSVFFCKFWRRSPNWIWADTDDTTTQVDRDTIFWPSKVDENVIALRNHGNNNCCKRLTTEGKTSCLNAAVSSITNEARLLMEEPVISRKICDVQFHLKNAKINCQNPIRMVSVPVSNNTSTPNNETLKFTYTNTMIKTWNFNISVNTSVKTSIKAKVPFLADGKIELSAEVQGSYQHEGTETTTSTLEATHQFTVQPKSTVTATLVATMGNYNVPFSYTQCDTLFDGRVVTYRKDDGMFSGSNCLEVRIVTE